MFIEGIYYKNKLFRGVTDATLYNIDAIHPNSYVITIRLVRLIKGKISDLKCFILLASILRNRGFIIFAP